MTPDPLLLDLADVPLDVVAGFATRSRPAGRDASGERAGALLR